MKMTLKTLICRLLIVTGGTCYAYGEAGACPNKPVVWSNRPVVWSNNTIVCSNNPDCYRGAYIRGFGGLNLAQKPRWKHAKYNTSYGYVVGGALGYQFDLLSLEGEFSYRNNTVNHLKINALDIDVSGHLEQLCGFGNLFINIPVTHCFVPYAGAGAGYRHMKPGVNFDESSDTSFRHFIDTSSEWGVYQLIGGFNLTLCQLVRVQLEYRYMDGWSNAKCSNHTVDLSAMFHF